MNPNVLSIIRVPGRLVINPTTLTGSYPFGGTGIGIHRDIEIRFNAKYYENKAEEFGMVPAEVLYCGQDVILKGYARGFDPDAIQYLWPFSTRGGDGQQYITEIPMGTSGNLRAGSLMSALSVKLLFCPHDTTDHPFVVIYRAIPTIPDDGNMPLTRSEEFAYPFAYRGIPDTSGRLYAIGTAADISL